MKRQRTTNSDPNSANWDSGDDSISDMDDDKFDSARGGSSQSRITRPKKKRKGMFSEAPQEFNNMIGPVLYSPGFLLPQELDLESNVGKDLHIFILPEYINTENEQVKNEELWGSNPYTVDSDPVCIIKHSGLYHVGPALTEEFAALRLMLRIQSGAVSFEGSESSGIKSKACGPRTVCFSALQLHTIRDPETIALIEQLKKNQILGPLRTEKSSSKTKEAGNVVPVMSKSRRSRKQKVLEEIDTTISIDVLPDTLLQFNLSNELCFQYNLNLVCDRGIEPSQWTSHRLRNAVLILETSTKRYELSLEDKSTENPQTSGPKFDTYRWALVKSPSTMTRAWCSKNTIPLLPELIDVIYTGLDWSNLVWGPSSLSINNTSYPVRKMFWVAKSMPTTKNVNN